MSGCSFTNIPFPLTVTRSHKLNDRDHSGEEPLPRYFAKSGFLDADPKKTKKDGGGKANWGREGEEVHDYGYTFANARRRSNSSNQGLEDFKTKFEAVEHDPVFEEEDINDPDKELDAENANARSNNSEANANEVGGLNSEIKKAKAS
ncbi:conserved hypothetical protein [Uncinocarpus reesii 1704]|uniref:Hyaluronan/mRNA-binding protein domain-containing protein n=1 Tax=Uncinocarpus reesii (strain UAMH 1704) TaxID=336963 RepID=C4JT98_UNCRE|nr:uncharacterized protein UREG_05687 [Uncinocarpus reesii 1704]EEP80845.1 conserved hypothetical protein [Uncinocarpus reesii 1704]